MERWLMDFAQLLARHDHPTHWECPPGFDYETSNARFSRFVSDLSAILGVSIPSETGTFIQDASFHSQAFLPLPDGRQLLIRFSNFGDMVAVGDGEPVPKPLLAVVLDLLTPRGYTYVPTSELSAPYTGANPGVTGISTWWERYFDWI